MSKHSYLKADIIKMKEAVVILRRLQEKIENDLLAYNKIDNAMSHIERIIEEAEAEDEDRISDSWYHQEITG